MRKFIYGILFISFILSLSLSCGGDDPPNGNDDTTPPTVLNTNPDDNTVDVPVAGNIYINFSEKINQATATSSNIVFNPPVNGSITASDSTVIFNPSSNLAYFTDYIVTISNITDLAGNKLSGSYAFNFKTEQDPATSVPEVISSSPANGEINVSVDKTISVTFNKFINTATVTNATFYIENVSGTFTFSQSFSPDRHTVLFDPDVTLEYDTTYQLIITTGIEDTFGNNLEQNDTISFSTPSLTPGVVSLAPVDSAVATGTIDLFFVASHPIGIARYELYVDGALDQSDISTAGTHTFSYDFSSFEIGSVHSFYCIAYDAADNAGYSDTLNLIAHWEIMAIDGNDDFNPLDVPNDVRKILSRSTDSTLELRIEYGYDWVYPYVDTAVDLGLFFDTDLNGQTGRRDAAADSLNGIGADYRMILGLHGGDTCLSVWNEVAVRWDLIYDTTGLVYHNLPQDTNVMEISLKWDDLMVVSSLYLVGVNVYFPDQNDPNFFITDFVPDRGSGYITIERADRFVGAPPKPTNTGVHSSSIAAPKINIPNPFK